MSTEYAIRDTATGVWVPGAAPATSTPLTDAGVKTANYTATADQLVRFDCTSGALALTLPTAPTVGTRVVGKKVDSSANALTVQRGGSDVFNVAGGSTSLSLAYQFATVTVQYIGSNIWVVTSTDPGAGGVTPSTGLLKANNLNDVASASSARTNLGLGTAATANKVAAGTAGVLDATDATTTNARTPTAHAASHAPAGSDDLTTALSATSVPVALGTAAVGSGTGFSRQGHVHPTTGLVLPARLVSTGYGLTGGGDLSADRTHAVALTSDSGSLAADVAIPATTLTTLLTTNSLAVGTWLLIAPVTILGGATAAAIDIAAGVGTATATFSTASVTARAAITTVTSATLAVFAVVTVAGTVVVTAYASFAATARKLGTANSTPGATSYTAVRIA